MSKAPAAQLRESQTVGVGVKSRKPPRAEGKAAGRGPKGTPSGGKRRGGGGGVAVRDGDVALPWMQGLK